LVAFHGVCNARNKNDALFCWKKDKLGAIKPPLCASTHFVGLM
jgi:hypothetical protein